MKKTLSLIVFPILLLALFLSSCEDPIEYENVLIGSWKYTDYQTGDWEKISFYEDLDYRLVNFNANYDQTTTVTGTYTYTDTTFTLKSRGASPLEVVFMYAVDDVQLLVYPGKTYVRQ